VLGVRVISWGFGVVSLLMDGLLVIDLLLLVWDVLTLS